jgi:membrane protein implicated in regulation of membrane protease activity
MDYYSISYLSGSTFEIRHTAHRVCPLSRKIDPMLDSPSEWRWIWLVMAVIFTGSEMAAPATFFFLPFGIGALAAAILSFFGVAVAITWFVFIIVSVIAFSSFWKLGRRLERLDEEQEGVGATRWVGQEAIVVRSIGPNDAIGRVRLERETWRAESLTGKVIAKGAKVLVARLAGTRLVVVPVEEPEVSNTNIDLRSGGSAAVSGKE